MSSPGQSGYVLYHYHPNLAAAATASVLFLATLILHLYQIIRTAPKSYFTLPLIVGIACECAGYVGRFFNSLEHPSTFAQEETYALAPYIVQSILLLVAPPLIAATLYVHLGHIIRATLSYQLLPVRVDVVTKTFVIGDVLSFMIQTTGASLLTKSEQESKDAGNWIVIGGLVVQLIFFGVFMITLTMFWVRLHKHSTAPTSTETHTSNCDILLAEPEQETASHLSCVPWRSHLCVLLITSTLILLRSIFRLVEYTQGPSGYLFSHEIYLYLFDGLLMLGAVAAWNLVHFTGVTAFVHGDLAIRKVFWVEGVDKLCKAAQPSPSCIALRDRDDAGNGDAEEARVFHPVTWSRE